MRRIRQQSALGRSALSGENQKSEPQANTNAQKLGVIQILEVAVPILNLVERR